MMASVWLRIAALAIVVILGVCLFEAWRGARLEQAALQGKLAAAEKALQDADARQDVRDKTLQQSLAELKKNKAAVKTPEQVVKALPSVLPLPAPIAMETAQNPPPASQIQSQPEDKAGTTEPKLVLPVQDLKPLYDAAVECKECQAELTAAQGDLADEKTKNAALGRERDDALQAAKGGSVLRRVMRAAKWFAIGVAAGAVAAKMAR